MSSQDAAHRHSAFFMKVSKKEGNTTMTHLTAALYGWIEKFSKIIFPKWSGNVHFCRYHVLKLDNLGVKL